MFPSTPTKEKKPVAQSSQGWSHHRHPAVEQKIQHLVDELCGHIKQYFRPRQYLSIAITGGYGRGEGGMRYEKGQASPNNNLDLIWVVPNGQDLQPLQQLFRTKVAQPLAQKFGMDIDGYFIHEKHIQRLPCLVMLYDIKAGHRVILGDPHYLKQHIHYESHDILPSDMRNLMVNRATLLLLNIWLLQQFQRQHPEQTTLPDALQQKIFKHTMKAIIGYGDALLFAQGAYHWSYAVKEQTMGVQVNLPVVLRQGYSQAIQYRFDPRGFQPETLGLQGQAPEQFKQWQYTLLAFFAPWHLYFENWRLQTRLTHWDTYVETHLCHSIMAENSYRGVPLRKLKHFLRNQLPTDHLSWKASLGLKMSEPANALSTLFPLIAYHAPLPAFVYDQLMISPHATQAEVLQRYLQCWGSYLDPSLLNKMRQWEEKLI